MSPQFFSLFSLLTVCLFFGSPGRLAAQSGPYDLRGRISAHDPSTIIKCKDRYYTFHTGNGILSSWSSNKIFWSAGPRVFANPPAWTTNAVPEFTGTFWAPDAIYFSNRYHLYYSVSSWGKQVSAIGLATNPTLDPTDPNYLWTDHGVVIQSQVGSPYNTIDPGVTWDLQGKLWLVFGSYWSGIYLVQLDPATGMRISANSPTHRLAWKSAIEASWIYPRGNYYYLFVNWGSCCSGVNSTYNIRVGRSTSITGPYYDANGINLVDGGGTLFMRASGKYAGPGHVGVIRENGVELFSFHYYDANSWANNYGAYGTARLGLAPLLWSANNWPLQTNDWSATYCFDYDAAEENGQHYGLLKDGAKVAQTADRGSVLDLDGTGPHVWLPPGVAYAQTFSAVVKWRGGGGWQRIFDFGFDTSRTFMLTPSSGDGVLRCDLNPGGDLQIVQWDRPLPTNVWTQVAVTVDGDKGILYVNGAAVATNDAMDRLPLNGAFQTNHLGRSKFSADPFFNGQYARFSVFGRALSRAELTMPVPEIASPVDQTSYVPGARIAFQGDATDFMAAPIGPSNLTWTVRYINGTLTNTVLGPLSGVSNGFFDTPGGVATGFYQITLAARDTAGRQASRTATLFPNGAAGTNWSSYYPFTTGGQDASNLHNATLYGTTIQTDALRGKVLNLTGSGQYATLPTRAATAQTVSAWVKWRGGNAWQRLFDFGRDNTSWFYFCPKDGSGYPEAALTSDRMSYVESIEAPEPFPLNTWTHVAVVVDGRQGILYFNGRAVAVNNSLNLFPSDVIGSRAYVGRSQYSNDPYLNAQIDSLKLNSLPLSPSEIFAPIARILEPTPGKLFAGGDNLVLAAEALDWTELPLPGEASQWSVEYQNPGGRDTVLGPLNANSASYTVPRVGPLSTNVYYQVNLLVTNAVGISAYASARVLPKVSRVELHTVPEGLPLLIDGEPLLGGAILDLVPGYSRNLAAPVSQVVGGTNYDFVLWSDLGAASHSFIVPLTNSSFTASYMRPPLSLAASGTGPVVGLQLSWPAWAPLAIYSTTNLLSGTWFPITNQPVRVADVLTVTLPPAVGQQFFRLQP